MNLIELMNERYSTKKFDKTKKISDSDLKQITELLRLSASSVNSQPWSFIIASTEEGKEKVSKSTGDVFPFNTEKILNASHVVVFCAKTSLDEEHLEKVLAKEEKDGRFADEESKITMDSARKKFINLHKNDLKDVEHWIDKQVYLSLGSLLLGVAALGIDSVPMEGFDYKILDKELGLTEKGLRSVLILPIGYRASDDFNAKLPKSRLSEKEVITII